MRVVRFGLVLLACASMGLGGCLHREQFYGTVAESEQTVIGRENFDGFVLETRQQFLTDYDFWGSRDAGWRYDFFITNTSSTTRCFRFTASNLQNYAVREKNEGYTLNIAPGQQGHVAYIRVDSSPGHAPLGDVSHC